MIHTVSRAEDLADLLGRQPDARFVLERTTSMLRHGMTARELWSTAEVVRRAPEGPGRGRRPAPAARPRRPPLRGAPADERRRRRRARRSTPSGSATSAPPSWPRCARRTPTSPSARGSAPTSGSATASALRVTATVLDVHAVERGDGFGYRAPHRPEGRARAGRQRRHRPRHRPRGARSATPACKARAATLARGGLDAAGFVRSPFSIDGKQRLFAEPPHMQASMLFLPARRPGAGGRRPGRRAGALHRDGVRPRRRRREADVGPHRVAPRVTRGRAPPSRPGRARPRSAPASRPSRSRRRRRRPGAR